ncbi:uncharacterized protein LOC130273682 isoform X2 [Hyla sarda]|uniref:uncharacterized protein LOC130273682 isoform X2 n=1 Tax=Hyla sarda TaxID=327740 RepID=UPI0024C3AE49|nr:uncharacterized protein LOC130273682 isoform X2 [Hyla sarda]
MMLQPDRIVFWMILPAKKTMYRPYKHIRRGFKKSRGLKFFRPRFACEHCRIACTSFKQLEQHLNGIKHKETLDSIEGEQNTFPLEHMVVLDEIEDDLPNDVAASPASCDSSDCETAACASDFQTIDSIPRSRMVILDETNDDNDNPASPASCDSSEFASSIPERKTRIKKPEDDQTASESPLHVLSSFPSTSYVPEVKAGTSEKSTSKERHTKSSKTRHEKSKKTFYIEPIKNNQDVFQFLKTFAMANDSDVEFANKVKEMFSSALIKYNERKLAEIICTEAEHSSADEHAGPDDGSSDHEQGNSIPQVTIKTEKTNSAPSSPNNSSSEQCIYITVSSVDCKDDSPIIIESDNPDTFSIASRSPTKECEDIGSSNKPPSTNSTNDNSCSAIEADLLMESENCVTTEAACSDDDDV